MPQDSGHIKILSPAKINLFLHVTGKRPDGYHALFTLMCCIRLYDTIYLSARGEGITVLCNHPGVPTGEKNIAWKPDIILMDRNMPEMDGLTCMRKIYESDKTARFILISGYDEEGPNGIDPGSREMISGYLTKPLDIIELSRLLSETLKD